MLEGLLTQPICGIVARCFPRVRIQMGEDDIYRQGQQVKIGSKDSSEIWQCGVYLSMAMRSLYESVVGTIGMVERVFPEDIGVGRQEALQRYQRVLHVFRLEWAWTLLLWIYHSSLYSYSMLGVPL